MNFGAQTDQVYNPAAGVDDRAGSVDVLNALIVSGTDGSGTVIATLVNNDQTHADSLRGVAGAGADSSLQVTPGGTTAIPADGLLNLATDGHVAVRGDRVCRATSSTSRSPSTAARRSPSRPRWSRRVDPVYKDVKVPS